MADVKIENKSSEQQRNQTEQRTGSSPQHNHPEQQRGFTSTRTQESQGGGALSSRSDYWPSSSEFFANPFGLMRRLSEEMDRAFGTSRGLGREMGSFWPAVEVKEQNGNLIVCADLPGINKDDIKVEVQHEALVIHGERKQEHAENQGGWRRSERSYGEFYRTIPLPDGVDAERAQAQFKDGVLEVRVPLPESQQRNKSRQIPIK
ncbi:MAG: Hsp20/alpha crystallin family protein [Bryobacteraceae bacterium]